MRVEPNSTPRMVFPFSIAFLMLSGSIFIFDP
jgi:hypothetical protein